MHIASGGWDGASALVGTIRIRVTPAGGSSPAFVGIAPAAAAARYLTGVAYATVQGMTGHQGDLHRARRFRARGPAGPGRYLDRAGGRAGPSDADLGGEER